MRSTKSLDSEKRTFAATLLTHIYNKADTAWQMRLLKRLDRYIVNCFNTEQSISLGEIASAKPAQVYVQYSKGRSVAELATIDGKKLYHKEDDFVELQASVLVQDNQLVVSAITQDFSDNKILEAVLLKAYFNWSKIPVVDLTEANVIEGRYRSRGLPVFSRGLVGPATKFIDLPSLPNKKAWKVGNELWINIANPTMKRVYDALQDDILGTDKVRYAATLINILTYEYDRVISDLSKWIKDET